jgi:hypothetical protein
MMKPHLGLLAQFRLQEFVEHHLALFGGALRNFMAGRLEMAGDHGIVVRLLNGFQQFLKPLRNVPKIVQVRPERSFSTGFDDRTASNMPMSVLKLNLMKFSRAFCGS